MTGGMDIAGLTGSRETAFKASEIGRAGDEPE